MHDNNDSNNNSSSTTTNITATATTPSLQPSLIHISEILQHSIELKLCSSVSTHNVFWDTLLHGVENNQEAMSLIISLLLTKYIQLTNYEKSKGISLIQALYSKITNSNVILSHDEITNSLTGKGNTSLSSSTTTTTTTIPTSSISTSQDYDTDEYDDEDTDGSTPSTPILSRSQSTSLSNLETLILDDQPILMNNTQPTPSPTTQPTLEENKIEIGLNSEEYKENEIIKSSILSTITFLSLNYSFNSNFPTLKLILAKFNELKVDKSKPEFIIQSELNRILSNGFKDSNEFIFFLLDQSADFVNNNNNNNSNNNEQKQLRNSWFNSHLRELLKSSISKSKMIFDNLFLFLKHPLLMEKRMLYFLQMLKHYLLVTPIISTSTITNAISIVKTYYLWPKPYCDFARELLEILTIEEKCPGSYFRSILSLEIPSLSLYANTLAGGNSNINHENGNNNNIAQSRPTIHMLIDRYNSEALVIQELFENNSKTFSSNTSQLQVNNIANIYYRVMGIDNSSLGLEFLDVPDISHFHFKILDVMNKTIYFEESECKSIRIKELSNLREEIIKTVLSYDNHKKLIKFYPQPIHLPNLTYQFHSLNRISIRNKKPDEFGSPYQIPLYKKTITSLLSIFNSYQDQDFHNTCKLVIVGNDASIQHVLSTYVYLQHQSQFLFKDIDVEFYILPATGGNTSGGGVGSGGSIINTNSECLSKFNDYLSSFDPWYYRQSCQIIKSLYNIIPTFSITPTTQSSNTDQSFLESISQIHLNGNVDSNGSTIGENDATSKRNSNDIITENQIAPIKTASYVIQSEIEYLFREASFRVDIPIMKCECWSDDQYYTIPFLMRAELSLQSFVQSQCEGLNLDQTQINKIQSKFVPFGIFSKFQQIGQSEPSIIESKSFNEILIQNIYPKSINTSQQQQYQQYQPRMELTLTEEKKKKVEKYNFNLDTIDIELSDKKKFDILLDGQLFGPVNRINISYCTLKPTFDKNNKMEQQYICFPVMTFLPNF